MRAAALLLLLVWCRPLLGLEVTRHSLTGTRVREVSMPRCVVLRGPLRPFTCDGVPLFFNASQPARVFDPNPVAALNDPSLMDQNDSAAAVPEQAYRDAAVDLLGPSARIVDRQAPATTQPDPGAPLLFDRGDDRFEPVNAVFHIDRTQRHLQSLGYTGPRQLVPYAIEVDPLALTGADTSFFLPTGLEPGRGTLFFGSGGTDDAEDADLVVHEYGHAVLEWIAPGTFGGSFSSESRAVSEGFGDYLAFSSHYETRLASGRDPFCFADWDARCWTDVPSEGCAYPAGSDCLRRLDSPRTMADYQQSDVSGVEHRNGQIWSSALREIFLALGRRTTDILVIESLFDAPPHPTFAAMARRLVETDRLLYGGIHRDVICRAMTSRGIAVSCDGAPRGELTLFPAGTRGIPIPEPDPAGIVSRIVVDDPRAIERIGVRVDIDHPSRGDLRIELVAPDGTAVLLQNVSLESTRDIHVTFGFDAGTAQTLDVLRGHSAGGTWELRVADLRSRDVGTLQSWALVIQFAGDEPRAARPRRAKTQMIPVIAHLFGAAGAEWRSDVQLANVTAAAQTTTLIFTRSGDDGSTDFNAFDVRLAPGQTVMFEDVLSSAFFTEGSGSLEVLGEVVASSRTYSRPAGGGTLGTLVPAGLESITRNDFPIYAAALPSVDSRYNLGVTEIAGRSGRVRVSAGSSSSEHDLPAWSHLQFALALPEAAISVVSGDAEVVGYVSQIEQATGDSMFVPALRQRSRAVIAPAISANGAGFRWQTDLWLPVPVPAFPFVISLDYTTGGVSAENRTLDSVQFDAVAAGWGRPGTAGTIYFGTSGEMLAHSRITNGASSQYVPFLPATVGDQHLLFVENGATYRTNLGLAARGAAVAEVIVFDAAGREVERHRLETPGGIAQEPVAAPLTEGWALVRMISGSGRGYASIIDRRTGDATYVPAQ